MWIVLNYVLNYLNLSEINFEQIYDSYIGKIYRFALLKVNSVELAQDLASETFTRAFAYFKENPDIDVRNMQAFLFRTVSNLVIDYYRQKSRSNVPLEFETKAVVEKIVPDSERPDFGLMKSENTAILRNALQKIDAVHAEILIWHYIDDLSVGEIAEITGRPEGTIRVMIHRGLRALREVLVVTL